MKVQESIPTVQTARYLAGACPQVKPISDEIISVEHTVEGYHARWRRLWFMVGYEWHGAQWWIHASVSRRDKQMPTYSDLKSLKRLTIGDDRMAVQVFSTSEKHIDIMGPHGLEVLHLWSPENADMLPDFGRYGTI